ncbi:MAG TPA: hypothetical protein VMK53_06525 [Gemmatimonadales bacterium]|nr:hypothetical protein [Gemmatimonadales bacterium]
MAVSAAVARKLCTAQEWTLVASSRGPTLKALPPYRLKSKVARARTLQDKYRALERRQAGEARGKRGARSTRPAQGNTNTALKTQIFAEALERYQRQLAAMERAAARKPAGKAKAAKAKAAKAAKLTAKARRGLARAARREDARTVASKVQSFSARGARKAGQMEAAGKTRIQGHIGSRGQRRQARRDSR